MLTATIGCDLGQRQAPVSSDAGVLSGSVTGSVKALPINGESISQPLFSTDLSNGYVDIHSVSVDTTNKTVTMTLTHHSGGLQWDRAFAIGFYEEGANQFGFRSILSDQDGALLWEFSYAVDTTDENHWWFSERTLFDEMTMEHRSGLDFTDEIYTINGVSQTFHFNTSDVDELKTLHRDLLGADKKQMQNMLSSSSINDVATILVLKEFDSFYDGDNSLHYNNDGALVVQLSSHAR